MSFATIPLSRPGPPTGRVVLGVYVGARLAEATAVAVSVSGRGTRIRGRILQSGRISLPAEAAELGRTLWEADLAPPAAMGELRSLLGPPIADLVAGLASRARPGAADEPLVVGMHEPGLWTVDEQTWPACLELVDPAPVAEATGLSVIDAFPARDLAGGGQGGPVLATSKWLLMGDVHRRRVLVDLGRTTRIVVCPPLFQRSAAAGFPQTQLTSISGVLATDVGPGMALLDALAARLSGDRIGHDPGGRFAVQGRLAPDLLERLLAAPYFQIPLPRWHPHGAGVDWFVEESVRYAVSANRSVHDLLCTATHFVAQALAEAIRRLAPPGAAAPELVLSGGGAANGLLLREIANRLPEYPAIALAALGLEPELFDAAAVAMLAVMHVDQTPATHTLITGVSTPRVLGRITPGAPRHWRRLVEQFSQSGSQTMALRSAV